MPTYDFRCPEGHVHEKFFKSIPQTNTPEKCPVCGKEATRQIGRGSGVAFKGSGFYETDYKGKR